MHITQIQLHGCLASTYVEASIAHNQLSAHQHTTEIEGLGLLSPSQSRPVRWYSAPDPPEGPAPHGSATSAWRPSSRHSASSRQWTAQRSPAAGAPLSRASSLNRHCMWCLEQPNNPSYMPWSDLASASRPPATAGARQALLTASKCCYPGTRHHRASRPVPTLPYASSAMALSSGSWSPSVGLPMNLTRTGRWHSGSFRKPIMGLTVRVALLQAEVIFDATARMVSEFRFLRGSAGIGDA